MFIVTDRRTHPKGSTYGCWVSPLTSFVGLRRAQRSVISDYTASIWRRYTALNLCSGLKVDLISGRHGGHPTGNSIAPWGNPRVVASKVGPARLQTAIELDVFSISRELMTWSPFTHVNKDKQAKEFFPEDYRSNCSDQLFNASNGFATTAGDYTQ